MGAIPRQTASARRTKGTSLCMLSSQLTRVMCSVTDDPAARRPLKPVLEQKECTATFGGADNVFARGPETLCPLRCYGSRPSSAPPLLHLADLLAKGTGRHPRTLAERRGEIGRAAKADQVGDVLDGCVAAGQQLLALAQALLADIGIYRHTQIATEDSRQPFAMGADQPRYFHQRRRGVQLLVDQTHGRTQGDFIGVLRELLVRRVQPFGTLFATGQVDTDAGHDLFRDERLGNVVGSTQSETLQTIFNRRDRAEKNDGDMPRGGGFAQ